MRTISIFLAGYLGGLAKATPHLGGSAIVRYGKTAWQTLSSERTLLMQLGLSADAELPLARLLQIGEGHSESHQQRWLVQAVNLQLQRDTFRLTHAPTLNIEAFEVLSQLLNNHFAHDGYHFEPSQSHQYWYLRLPQPIDSRTHDLQSALGQDVQRYQPHGPDGAVLRRIMNEAQMLLHEHPLNLARVAHGQPDINSVWISGGGDVQSLVSSVPFGGQSTLLQGLGIALGTPVYGSLDALLQQSARAIFHLEDASAIDWQQLFRQVKYGNIQQLMLYHPEGYQTRVITLNTLDCWKFWRKGDAAYALQND
jgi:hypothetical protein